MSEAHDRILLISAFVSRDPGRRPSSTPSALVAGIFNGENLRVTAAISEFMSSDDHRCCINHWAHLQISLTPVRRTPNAAITTSVYGGESLVIRLVKARAFVTAADELSLALMCLYAFFCVSRHVRVCIACWSVGQTWELHLQSSAHGGRRVVVRFLSIKDEPVHIVEYRIPCASPPMTCAPASGTRRARLCRIGSQSAFVSSRPAPALAGELSPSLSGGGTCPRNRIGLCYLLPPVRKRHVH